jgi:hypothetical protein
MITKNRIKSHCIFVNITSNKKVFTNGLVTSKPQNDTKMITKVAKKSQDHNFGES